LLGVDAECLEQFGAVSHETAVQMAEKCRARLGTDLAISLTGLAGPGDDGVHTVGTVFVALAAPEGTYVRRLYKDKWSRERIKHAAANHAFDMIRRYLEGMPVEYEERM
ncbi:MAG: CinA family protein, partial [Clostridia bacterium]|nr:CinA family protein [Clostridia bacterium]